MNKTYTAPEIIYAGSAKLPAKFVDEAALNAAEGELQVKRNVIMELGQALRHSELGRSGTAERLRISKLANESIIKQRGDAVRLLHMVVREYGDDLFAVHRDKIQAFLDTL